MDGTLVDSEKIYLAGFKHAFEQAGIRVDEANLKVFCGMSGEDELNEIDKFTNDREATNHVFETMITYCHREFSASRVELKANAERLLAHCKSQGLKIGLATSSYKDSATALLEKLGILDYFEFLVFGDEVSTPKPDPMIYHLAVHRSGFEGDGCLVVEDSFSGVTAAREALLAVIQICDDIRPVDFATYHVYDLSEILPIIDKLV